MALSTSLCLTDPDISIGPGDTAPMTRCRLRDPNNEDGSLGAATNLQNADLTFKTVKFRYQIRDYSAAWVTLQTGVIIRQTDPNTNRGIVDIDWLAAITALSLTVAAALPPGTDHRARYIVTDNASHQESFPNGKDIELPDGTNPSFLWLQVARDFVVVP